MTGKQYFRINRQDKATKAAIDRAKASKLFVRLAGEFRSYNVINRENGNTYTVELTRFPSGVIAGRCSCPSTVLCKHIVTCCGIHLGIAANRQTV